MRASQVRDLQGNEADALAEFIQAMPLALPVKEAEGANPRVPHLRRAEEGWYHQGSQGHWNKQRDYITKEDVSSPTVTAEAVMLTCVIDAQEGRDVAVVDIPNVFVICPNHCE